MGKFSPDKIFLIIFGLLTVFALILISAFALNEGKKQNIPGLTTYKSTDNLHPQVLASEKFQDFGPMSVNDEKTASFPLENTGRRPLQLYGITSSCNCTFGKLTIDGKDSPEFGMHSQSSWLGTLDPGQKATLSVLYRPRLMPIKGQVTRQVFVQTNDPQNGQLTFTIKAIVN